MRRGGVRRQHLCCGRPLYDYGFLDMANSYLQRESETLATRTSQPERQWSCWSRVVVRYFATRCTADSLTQRQAGGWPRTHSRLSEFLEKKVPGYQPPKVKRKAIVQGHCHHKAMMRFKEEKR